jgi:F0F1-type ATP synthase membrane subunit c/vacuolar-type H+-ATPase subunit K
MSGIIAVYALVVAVLIAGNMKPPPEMQYSLFNGFMHLACGLSVGLTGLAAGYAIGIVGDSVREAEIGRKAGTNQPCALLTLRRACAHTCSSHVSSLAWFLS